MLRAAADLFGSTERLEFEMPQCLLRVARFTGLDRMEFLDNRQFNGNAFTLLTNAERFLRDTLPIAGRFEQDRIERIDEPLYPLWPHVRRLRTLCATATIPSAAARSA